MSPRSTFRPAFVAPILVALVLTAAIAPLHAVDWTPQPVGETTDLEAVWFASWTRGWAVGAGGTAVYTRDAGTTWHALELTDVDLAGTAFAGDFAGLIVGDGGTILRTDDGGAVWLPSFSGTDADLRDVAFGVDDRAYAVGDGVILRSDNAGVSWTPAEESSRMHRGVWATGPSVWVVGDGGSVRASGDAGLTWSDQPSGTASDLTDVVFVGAARGWACGHRGTVIRTDDGGASWTASDDGIVVGLEAIHFANEAMGWTVGRDGFIFATADGGETWTVEASNTASDLRAVHFPYLGSGWAAGAMGSIVHRHNPATTVGGASGPGLALHPPGPNPANPATRVAFELATPAYVELAVHDARGRLIRRLARGEHDAGAHAVAWDGIDGGGRPVAAGLYLLRLAGGGETVTRKLMLVE